MLFSSLALLTLVSSSLAQGDAECPGQRWILAINWLNLLLFRWLVWCWQSGLLQVPRGKGAFIIHHMMFLFTHHYQGQPHLGGGPTGLWTTGRLPGRTNLQSVSLWVICIVQHLNDLNLLRQIDFLAELALLEGSFTGVGFWYIGLTDLGNF